MSNPFETILKDIQHNYLQCKQPKGLDQCGSQYLQPSKSEVKLDAILFLNLDHRTDRRLNIEKTIELIRPITKEVHRIDAIQHKNGAKGCTLSHLKALSFIEMHPEWTNVLILEDDAELDMEPIEFKQSLQQILCRPYDVIICGSEIWDPELNKCVEVCCPVTHSQCSTAYIIHQQYVPILKQLWEFCANQLGDTLCRSEYKIYAIDQAWKQLMPLHTWLWFRGNPFRQYPSYSDIEHKNVAYKYRPRNYKERPEFKPL